MAPDAHPLPAHLRPETNGIAAPETVAAGEHHRFTVLTSRLLRLEYSPSGTFADRASQVVLHRDLDRPDFDLVDSGRTLELITEHLHLTYDKGPFSTGGLSVQVRGNVSNHHSHWRYGEDGTNLGGTARTLDEADGVIDLEPGLMSRDGYAVLDDSASLLFDEAGWFSTREPGSIDLYLFAYGRDYPAALQDFYRLTGPQPLLPRFALGNWWSRYHPYSADEYRALMERFAAERIPFSVAVLDMDWHLVDIDERFGSGWTGYTWNRDLFGDPSAFADWLHERGLRLTLNVHPAAGVQAHEDAYAAMATALGVDPATEAPLVFDVTDPEFLAAYFTHVHHPLEEGGVDFWWLDWQSGPHSLVPGLDPLWVLNHLHFLDSSRDGGRPLTFSRYAGPGSHRYPIGFSGDTVISWESLDFQPYFTATASNIGYGWWSHDIGGHMFGAKDDELALRWVQYGVFAPILRLHSTANRFSGKEPWRHAEPYASIMADQLRLRQQLIPYLHTMNHRAADEGRPLVEPMYYAHPDVNEAYRVPNQYAFGTELLVAPITAPVDARLRLGSVRVWLPPGTWIDAFTATVYTGGRYALLHRDLGSIPVLARAGAILPMTAPEALGNEAENPGSLLVKVFGGASGEFTLVEDREDAAPDETCRTKISFAWESGILTVHPSEGDLTAIPARRDFTVELVAVDGFESVTVTADGADHDQLIAERTPGRSRLIKVPAVDPAVGFTVAAAQAPSLVPNDVVGSVHRMLDAAQISYGTKEEVQAAVEGGHSPGHLIAHLSAVDLPPGLYEALLEVVLADSSPPDVR
ncbi:MAG: TIM-barrel domain-containing protein [Propionibacteriaceae bacterium]